METFMVLRWLLHSVSNRFSSSSSSSSSSSKDIDHDDDDQFYYLSSNGTGADHIHDHVAAEKQQGKCGGGGEGFQMPLHYPRYKKTDYEKMEEWKVDSLLREYGLSSFKGTLEEKRAFAIGAFLWPDQL